MARSEVLGTQPVGRLLFKQALPAALGFMAMSINSVVDTIYLGKYIDPKAIGAVTAVSAIVFLFAVLGMAIGIGGSSIVSRALGAGDDRKAGLAFNNQVTLVVIAMAVIYVICYSIPGPLVRLFGAKDELFDMGYEYFMIVFIGVPFLAWGMMSNNNIRAEGRASIAMMILLIPSVSNILLDDIFIRQLGWGISGAAWATSLSFVLSALFAFFYFLSGKSELKFRLADMKLNRRIVGQISSIGFVSLLRQGSISVLMIVLSWSLHKYGEQDIAVVNGGEMAYSSYGVASRIAMFAFFPLIGISQGFMPIAGYNYGARKLDRVRKAISFSVWSGTLIATVLCAILLLSASVIPGWFGVKGEMVSHASDAIFYVFMATPLVMLPFIGSSYYQAIGKPIPAALLTLTKQTFCLIPAVLILPLLFGLDGVWYSFPVADTAAALICLYYLLRISKKLRLQAKA